MGKVIFIVFALSCMVLNTAQAQGDNVHYNNLLQSDTRIYVSLHHNRTIGLGAQYVGVKIKNNTGDILRVQLEFYSDMVCGERLNQRIGFGEGISIQPGETIGAKGFWDSDNTSFDAGNRRSSGCLNSSDKSKKIGENDYTAIQNVGYRLISIENISEKKRQEEAKSEAEAKKRKEEEERARLEREAIAKKKKEDEERTRLEKEAAEKKKREEQEKARLAKTAVTENQSGNSQGSPGSYPNSLSIYGNTANQNKQSELERQKQLQVQKNEELKRQQQLAQEEAERKRQQQFEEMQAKIAENKRKTEALNVASQETMNQWSQGNFIEGSTALVNEYAAQGNSDAALTTLAVGTGLQIVSWISEGNREKEEAEARRAEQARVAEEERRRIAEIEEQKRQILEQQKREFNILVEENRGIKKNIIHKRDQFLDGKVVHTPTFDVFSEEEQPIYIFYVQPNKDYNNYDERIVFPDRIEIHINEDAELHFSPIIAIHPNSSGEYPFVKELLSEIKSRHVDPEKGKHKVYNWSRSLEEIQAVYNEEAILARQAYFTVVFPEETIIRHSEKGKVASEEDAIDYWENETTAKEKVKAAKEIKQTKEAKEPAAKDKKQEEIDYWNIPAK